MGFFKFVLKNQKNDTLAIKLPIGGDMKAVGAKIWPTITNIFRNAWIRALKGVVDDDVDFQDAIEGAAKKKGPGKNRRSPIWPLSEGIV